MQKSNEATLCYYGTDERVVSVVATIRHGNTVIEQKKFTVDDYSNFAELSNDIFEYTKKHNVSDLVSMSETFLPDVETHVN